MLRWKGDKFLFQQNINVRQEERSNRITMSSVLVLHEPIVTLPDDLKVLAH